MKIWLYGVEFEFQITGVGWSVTASSEIGHYVFTNRLTPTPRWLRIYDAREHQWRPDLQQHDMDMIWEWFKFP